MSEFILRTYEVTVSGFERPAIYYAPTPAKARSLAYRGLTGAGYEYTYKDFLRAHTLRRVDDPSGFGDPILVEGKPAFRAGPKVSNQVPFVYPGKDFILWSHELDVAEPSNIAGSSGDD